MESEMEVNEELKKLSADALMELYTSLLSAKNFALEQAPEVCQQIIRWQIFMGCVAAFALLLAIGLFIVIYRMTNGIRPFLTTVMLILLVVFFPVFFIPMRSGAKAWIAPKLCLIEYVKGFIDGK